MKNGYSYQGKNENRLYNTTMWGPGSAGSHAKFTKKLDETILSEKSRRQTRMRAMKDQV